MGVFGLMFFFLHDCCATLSQSERKKADQAFETNDQLTDATSGMKETTGND